MTRFCVDCRHSGWVPRMGHRCFRPRGPATVNLVTGNRETSSSRTCEFERGGSDGWFFKSNRCGPDARYFEPAPERPPPTRG